MKKIKTIGVVGAGTMGSALAQKFAQEGFRVILADRADEFVQRGIASITKTLQEGVARKVFTAGQVEDYLKNVTGSSVLNDLRDCDLVVEAIFENFDAKKALFRELSEILSESCILATNTSSYSVSELAESYSKPENFIGLHFFYHAAKNRLVEIIPGKQTSSETFKAVEQFAFLAGKDAIVCKDEYGFAVNRFFVPWLNEASRLFEEKIATPYQIDEVCCRVFGIGMGPFALMNATGVPVAYHSEKTLEVFGNLYKVSQKLREQAESGRPWLIEENCEQASGFTESVIRDRMLGVTFFVSSQILEEKVCTAADLDKGARIGLKWSTGPVGMMKREGEAVVNMLVAQIASGYKMSVPQAIGERYWKIEKISLQNNPNDSVILRFDNPQSLNALDEVTVNELGGKFDKAEKKAKTIFITGAGKAFVAGADIGFFVNNIRQEKIAEIESFTKYGQDIFDRIDKSSSRVVAILNGLTLGGGLELALCADVILALPNVRMAFPETGIGIYPGLGGTQRSTRRIGKGLSKYLILTGRQLSAQDAEAIGLIDKVITTDEMFSILSGEMEIPEVEHKDIPENWRHIASFFEHNPVAELLQHKIYDHSLPAEEAQKIIKTMSFKAPIALRIADLLIEEEKGCESELEHLNEIFSTEDALLGLTSIGRKVEYQGR